MTLEPNNVRKFCQTAAEIIQAAEAGRFEVMVLVTVPRGGGPVQTYGIVAPGRSADRFCRAVAKGIEREFMDEGVLLRPGPPPGIIVPS